MGGGRWLLAHVKAPAAAEELYFGHSVSFGGGGVLAIGSEKSCKVHVVDVW